MKTETYLLLAVGVAQAEFMSRFGNKRPDHAFEATTVQSVAGNDRIARQMALVK